MAAVGIAAASQTAPAGAAANNLPKVAAGQFVPGTTEGVVIQARAGGHGGHSGGHGGAHFGGGSRGFGGGVAISGGGYRGGGLSYYGGGHSRHGHRHYGGYFPSVIWGAPYYYGAYGYSDYDYYDDDCRLTRVKERRCWRDSDGDRQCGVRWVTRRYCD